MHSDDAPSILRQLIKETNHATRTRDRPTVARSAALEVTALIASAAPNRQHEQGRSKTTMNVKDTLNRMLGPSC